MSVNIKTANGLKKLSGDTLTKHSIAATLGYTPADPDSVNADLTSHTTNDDIHVTLAEKDKFTDYKQLRNTPNIIDDGSGEFTISDPSGNTALQVSSDGVTKIASLTVAGRDLSTFMDQTDFDTFDPDRHITPAEREQWNDTSKMNGNIQIEDDGAEFAIVDSNGNAAVMIDSIGTIQLKDAEDNFQITDSEGNVAVQLSNSGILNVAELEIKGENILSTIEQAEEEFAAALSLHEEKVIHITEDERTKWNDKSWSSITDKPDIIPGDEEFLISDSTGQSAFLVDSQGRTNVANLNVHGVNVMDEISSVADNAAANLTSHEEKNIHITSEERANWNDKSKLTGDIQIEDEGNDFIVQDLAGQIALQITSDGITKVATVEVNKIEVAGVDVANEFVRIEDSLRADITDHTTTVTGNPHNVTPQDLNLELVDNTRDVDKPVSTLQKAEHDALDKKIGNVEADLDAHTLSETTSDGPKHIQQGERTFWNDKSWASLTDKPNIHDDESGEFTIEDSNGDIAFQIDTNGITNVAKLSIDGADVETRFDGIDAEITNIKSGNTVVAHAELADYATESGHAGSADNASTANSWTTSRTLKLVGDASGDVDIDGSADIELNVEIKNDSHTHFITADSEDDKIVTLEGTGGDSQVKYKAAHAVSGVTAGTYTNVTVNSTGHVTSGSRPDNIADLGITNVYTKAEVDANIIDAIDAIPEADWEATHFDVPGTTIYEATLKFTSSSIWGIPNSGFKIVMGSSVDVYWNGVKYSCVVSDYDEEPYIGNANIAFGASDTGEPFCLFGSILSGRDKILVAQKKTDSAETVTLKVTEPGTVGYSILPEEYLPETLVNQTELDQMKTQLSEQIVSESNSWYVEDTSGNMIVKVDPDGFETTNIQSTKVMIGSTDVEDALNTHSSEIYDIVNGDTPVALASHASTATTFARAVKITLDGDVSGNVELNGSGDVTLTTTVTGNIDYSSIQFDTNELVI